MKKISIISGVIAAMIMASCSSNQTADNNQPTQPGTFGSEKMAGLQAAAEDIKANYPDLWAAQNHDLELKADRSTMENPLDLNGFIQIAILVEDIVAAAREWSQLLNVPMPEIRVHQTVDTTDPNIMYYGSNYKYGLKLANIMAPQGFIIELHQVLDDNPNTYNEFIREHGYGVHHLGFAVGDRRDAVVNELEERGYPKRVEHIYPGGSWTVFDSEQALGVNINVKPAM